jgi:hypothetical protein
MLLLSCALYCWATHEEQGANRNIWSKRTRQISVALVVLTGMDVLFWLCAQYTMRRYLLPLEVICVISLGVSLGKKCAEIPRKKKDLVQGLESVGRESEKHKVEE